ncbi:MAG: selenocysteine-specific translation elongation factor [Gemmatimonadota bacterium]|nr:selenocysteine-specific translation elongation factor [Gemmatimonadota bacterium]
MSTHPFILGTAGHIDHGKTALVRALTGVDTDRLKEEQARGITIELGFAELSRDDLPRFGVVDVPGHEAFVRSMLAGAAGMDVVLLVVAADEGVMPQTREHLGIVRLLGVPEVVVAYTKRDLVDAEWMELVEADVDDLLAGTPYGDAPRVPTSAVDGTGVEELVHALAEAASKVPARDEVDLARLPLDRVFTIQGTGTVVTGTLWSGSLRTGDRVRILPRDLEARVRSLQVHGRGADVARAGERTAVALAGSGADRDVVDRGATLVASPAWSTSHMLTVRIQVLSDSDWSIQHNQRVHVHHGTAQVQARCVLLDEVEMLASGDVGWVQLRLEEPLVVRGRDRLVLRSYSPVTTIAGGIVAETHPPKRNRLDESVRARLARVLDGGDGETLVALLELSGWMGLEIAALPVRTGISAAGAERLLAEPVAADIEVRRSGERVFAPEIWGRARGLLVDAVTNEHARDPVRRAIPLAHVRSALPSWAPSGLADAVIRELVQDQALVSEDGGVRDPAHEPRLTTDQEEASKRLTEVLLAGGLAPPFVDELPEPLAGRPDLWSLLYWLEERGVVEQVADDLYVGRDHLRAAEERVRASLGGRVGLGPADFRDALDVTRKHLIPLLNYLDTRGVTLRREDGRSVPSD